MRKQLTIRNLFIIAMLGAWTVVQIRAIQNLSTGYDEPSFALYGTNILKGIGEKDIVKFDSKLPITAINMLPRAAQQVLSPGLHKTGWKEDVMSGRYMTLCATLLLALLILRWAGELTGNGIPAMALFLLCPNFLAHGVLVSSDMFACLFMTLALYGIWVVWTRYDHRGVFIAAAATGFALLSKFSMVHLALMVFLFVCFLSARGLRSRNWTKTRAAFLVLATVAIPWLILCAGHLFHDCFFRLGDHEYSSPVFRSLTAQFPSLHIPLPSAYVRSMDAVMYFDKLGGGVPGALNGAPYLLGRHAVNGFSYYYPLVMLFKIPLPTLIVIGWSLVMGVSAWYHRKVSMDRIVLLIPVGWFLIYMDLFYSTQVGIRHILIIFPLLFILASLVWKHAGGWKQGLLAGLLAWQLFDVGAYYPHFLPYTNNLVTNKTLAYTWLADTNLCYGEGDNYLQQYLQMHPEAIYAPEGPEAGKVVVEVNDYLDINMGSVNRYAWLRDSTPVDAIHSQFLIFQVNQTGK